MRDESSTPSKTCTRCGVEKPATVEFFAPHHQGRYGLRPDCLTCYAESRAQYRAAHREELRQKQTDRNRANGVVARCDYDASRARRVDPKSTLVCSQCGESKPATRDAFYVSRNGHLAARCKACARAHYEENVERERERQRKYRLDHLEAKRATDRAYYQEHRSEAIARSREWRSEDPERAKESRRREYEKHREQYIARSTKWQREHPESTRATSSRRRSAVGSHSAADIAAQRTRQHGRCFWCKGKVGRSYHVDHVVPLALGGSNDPENIVISCPRCNLSKGAKHPMEWAGCLL